MLAAKARFAPREKAYPLLKPVRQARSLHDPSICPNCQAVRHKGVWTLDPAIRRQLDRGQEATLLLCPACRLVREDAPCGILRLTGSYLSANSAEIFKLIRNGERAAMHKNPLERIIRIRTDSPHEIVIETTSDKLARRLGRAVVRAFRGTLRIRFSHQDKLVRLYGHRDVAEIPA